MEILKQRTLHNNFSQQHDQTAVLSLLIHLYFELFSYHIIQVYLYGYLYLFFFCYLQLNVFFTLHTKYLEISKKSFL